MFIFVKPDPISSIPEIKNNSNFYEYFDQLELVFQVLFANKLNVIFGLLRIRENSRFVVLELIVGKS